MQPARTSQSLASRERKKRVVRATCVIKPLSWAVRLSSGRFSAEMTCSSAPCVASLRVSADSITELHDNGRRERVGEGRCAAHLTRYSAGCPLPHLSATIPSPALACGVPASWACPLSAPRPPP